MDERKPVWQKPTVYRVSTEEVLELTELQDAFIGGFPPHSDPSP